MNIKDSALILLTYKGKILLMLRENNLNILEHVFWRFIGGKKQKNKSVKETITKLVEKETSIKLSTVDLISVISVNDMNEHFYSAKLTDDNVNNIKRADGHLLNFFTLNELEKLPLTSVTKLFVSKHRDILENVRSF